MKKLSILMSVLVIFSIFLAACGSSDNGQENGTPTTGGLSQTAAPLPGTGATKAATTAAPKGTATAAATTAATKAATAAATTAAATGLPGTGNQGTGNAVLLSKMMEADVRMVGNTAGTGTGNTAGTPAATQAITGTATTNTENSAMAEGQSFGTVKDLVVNLCSESILYVIVDANSDLAGTRTNNLMIPYDALKWVNGNNPTSAGNEHGYFMLNSSVNASVIQKAPDVDVKTLDFNSSTWETTLTSYWSAYMKNTGKTNQPANCTFSTGMSSTGGNQVNATGTPAATQEMTTTTTVNMNGISDKGIVLASNLIGMKVNDNNGEDIGEVNDVIVLVNGAGLAATGGSATGNTGSSKSTGTPQATQKATMQATKQATQSSSGVPSTGSNPNGDLRYIVVGAGGILGIGEKNIPVPATALSYDANNNSLVVNVAKDDFSKSPTIDLDKLDSVNWSADIDTYWMTK